jgi:hypothetical protein
VDKRGTNQRVVLRLWNGDTAGNVVVEFRSGTRSVLEFVVSRTVLRNRW